MQWQCKLYIGIIYFKARLSRNWFYLLIFWGSIIIVPQLRIRHWPFYSTPGKNINLYPLVSVVLELAQRMFDMPGKCLMYVN